MKTFRFKGKIKLFNFKKVGKYADVTRKEDGKKITKGNFNFKKYR